MARREELSLVPSLSMPWPRATPPQEQASELATYLLHPHVASTRLPPIPLSVGA
jgi:hypothetical protein